MSDALKIIVSIVGSALTVSVALAALILTSANDTRQQFNEQIELMRGHSDSQFDYLREDLREVRGEVREVRGDLREIRGEVRALAERQAKVEGLLAAYGPSLAPPSDAQGAGSPTSRAQRPELE